MTPDTVVATLPDVLRGAAPVLAVLHDGSGDWFFWPGRASDAGEEVDVPFGELLRADPGLAGLADLPADWLASRTRPDEPWRRRRAYENTRGLWANLQET
jgi:hypothetical protein